MSTADNFANGTSAVYVDSLFDDWKQDPNSVHASWRTYFENVENDAETPYQPPPSLGAIPAKAGASNPNIDEIIAALQAQGIGGGVGG